MSTFTVTVAVVVVLGASLMAGTFFAFSNFVMKALAERPTSEGIATMQAINVVVINPVFLITFVGTAAAGLVLAVVAMLNWSAPGSPSLLGGAVAYIAGTWLLTIVGNVPLNNRLAKVEPNTAEAAELWEHYLVRWTRLNSERAWAALLAVLLVVIGLVL